MGQMRDRWGWAKKEVRWLVGLIGAICTALSPDVLHLPDPWHRWVTLIGVATTAALGYGVQPFKDRGEPNPLAGDQGERRQYEDRMET